MPMDNDFVSFLWNSYKSHSDEKKNADLKEEMNEDNYLWKTVQPIEQRLITMEKRLSDMNKNMERMMELLAEKTNLRQSTDICINNMTLRTSVNYFTTLQNH